MIHVPAYLEELEESGGVNDRSVPIVLSSS